jgi:hypothetical protein
MMLLRNLSGASDIQEVLFHLCKVASLHKGKLEPFLRLGAFYTKEKEALEARLGAGNNSLESLLGQSLRAVNPDTNSDPGDIVTEVPHLIGITKDEVLSVFKRVHAELLGGKEAVATPIRKVNINPPWQIEPEIFTLPIDHRWDLIANRLLEGHSVSISDLKRLLARFSPVIEDIEKYSGPETPWFVAAAAFYKQPDDALTAIRDALRSGKESKYPPQEFLQTHATWVQSREGLGKLNYTSMKLNFGAPFRAPNQEDADA